MGERPRLLDLFSGAGGAARGYQLAGFHVTGVDINPQPRYAGDEFHQADAMTYPLDGFDAIHASPPCQGFSDLRHMYNAQPHDDLLTPTRARLIPLGVPYVIENVEGAPMDDYIVLCGGAFGLGSGDAELRRHRRFEVEPRPILVPPCAHGQRARVIGVYGGHGRDRRRSVNTQDFPVTARREAMGIDWMTDGELSQAIPPAYTEWIGQQLIQAIEDRAA
jgi:DNA (cytosine-5)-methyltransferase 1